MTFAFTTSPQWYGPTERVRSQLETGRDIARLMGGKDREDGVGQVSLGIWFAYKLKGELVSDIADCRNASPGRECGGTREE
jgi:hypothetical protein